MTRRRLVARGRWWSWLRWLSSSGASRVHLVVVTLAPDALYAPDDFVVRRTVCGQRAGEAGLRRRAPSPVGRDVSDYCAECLRAWESFLSGAPLPPSGDARQATAPRPLMRVVRPRRRAGARDRGE